METEHSTSGDAAGAVASSSGAAAGGSHGRLRGCRSSFARRRDRQLRAWHRHVRTTVAMELATALHHSARELQFASTALVSSVAQTFSSWRWTRGLVLSVHSCVFMANDVVATFVVDSGSCMFKAVSAGDEAFRGVFPPTMADPWGTAWMWQLMDVMS